MKRMQSRTAAGSRTIDLESLCRLVIAINHLRTLASTLSDCFFGQRLYFRSGAGLYRASSPSVVSSTTSVIASSATLRLLLITASSLCPRNQANHVIHHLSLFRLLSPVGRWTIPNGGGAGARSSSLDVRCMHWRTGALDRPGLPTARAKIWRRGI